MPDINEVRTPVDSNIACDCGSLIKGPHHFEIDETPVCDTCYVDRYTDMVKCKVKGCRWHDEQEKLDEGFCSMHFELR